MFVRISSIALFGLLSFASGCVSPGGDTVDEKRAYIRAMRDHAMGDMYKNDPAMREHVARAAGYAVFSNLDVQVLLISAGQGYGLVHDNATGRETYMRMGEIGGGFGAGLKDFRAIYVFLDHGSLETFTERGWEFGSDAAAAAKAGDKGGAASAQAHVSAGASSAGVGATSGRLDDTASSTAGRGIEIYQITENGLALQWTVAGTRYWKDAELN